VSGRNRRSRCLSASPARSGAIQRATSVRGPVADQPHPVCRSVPGSRETARDPPVCPEDGHIRKPATAPRSQCPVSFVTEGSCSAGVSDSLGHAVRRRVSMALTTVTSGPSSGSTQRPSPDPAPRLVVVRRFLRFIYQGLTAHQADTHSLADYLKEAKRVRSSDAKSRASPQ
jgi:hypothetical protein